MKIWVDDIRTPPDDWTGHWKWCKTSKEAIQCLQFWKGISESKMWKHLSEPVELMSLDHDLGGDDTTRPVVLWCCENEFWPDEVVVHSANPVGVEWLEGMIERYKNDA